MFLSLSMMTSVVSKTLLYYGTEGVGTQHTCSCNICYSYGFYLFLVSYQFHELILDKAESALRHGEGMHFTVSVLRPSSGFQFCATISAEVIDTSKQNMSNQNKSKENRLFLRHKLVVFMSIFCVKSILSVLDGRYPRRSGYI